MNNEFFFIHQPGMWMFRIFGYGLQFITYERSRPYFSERYGYRKPILKTNKWRIFFLEKLKQPKKSNPFQLRLIQGGKK